jgi:hypothetical protein
MKKDLIEHIFCLDIIGAAGLNSGHFNRKRNFKKSEYRYSAVRCLRQDIKAAGLKSKKPCHFGVVSYECFPVKTKFYDSIHL